MANTTGKKFGGRKKGTKNLKTSEVKEAIKGIVSNELDDVQALLQELSPNDRITAIIKLLPFVVPKQLAVEVEAPDDFFKPVVVNLIKKQNNEIT
jgi:23S rRNA C2498 (ribose-2'-O)-methylase RlmM